MIYGYKCFKKGLINNYGFKFEVDKTYHVSDNIVFGINGNGFHMCERLEDTLRFFDTFSYDVDICVVNGFGECIKRDDEYNDYYNMYACENIYIKKKLTREEIILYGLSLHGFRVMRFISLFRLSNDEKMLFRDKFKDNYLVNDYIDYYQDNKKDVFVRKLINNGGKNERISN